MAFRFPRDSGAHPGVLVGLEIGFAVEKVFSFRRGSFVKPRKRINQGSQSDKLKGHSRVLTFSFHTHDAEETFLFGEAAGKAAKPGDVWRLSGPLGAGKTAFVQGLAKGLGYEGRVTSPTFALQNIYEARLSLFHYDWYRLEKAAEVQDLGWEEWLTRGVTAVEWGDKFPGLFPPGALRLELEITDECTRRLILTAESGPAGTRAEEMIRCWPP